MSLLRSPSFNITDQTLHETLLPGENYVLSLTQIRHLYAASASSPSNQIHLFDRATLHSAGVLKGHAQGTSQLHTIRCPGSSTREMLLSSGKDGCVVAWDERSGSASIKMEASGKPLLCCDASDDGLLVVAGTGLQNEDAFIVYWDPRNPGAQLRSHGSTHSDDITVVQFLKSGCTGSNRVLLSASSDGLIGTSNALETDEDEAVTHIGNWGCSVSQGGWISDAQETRIWAASAMETFSCWSNELDQILTVDIRDPSLHDHGHTWVTDYLIKGHSTRKADNGLGVFVGSNEGDVALITNTNLSEPMSPWAIHSVWTGGHAGVVRSLCWDEEHGILLTGGEDSRIITWRIQDPDLACVSIVDESNNPMKLDVPSSKRDWDDTTDDVASPSGKRQRR